MLSPALRDASSSKLEVRVRRELHNLFPIRRLRGLFRFRSVLSETGCLLTDQSKLEVRAEDATSYSNSTLLHCAELQSKVPDGTKLCS